MRLKDEFDGQILNSMSKGGAVVLIDESEIQTSDSSHSKIWAWLFTIIGIVLAVIAIYIRFDMTLEELHRIAFRSWCTHRTWRMTEVLCWGPALLVPSFFAWFYAHFARITVWPARFFAVLATSWWIIGGFAVTWPRWGL